MKLVRGLAITATAAALMGGCRGERAELIIENALTSPLSSLPLTVDVQFAQSRRTFTADDFSPDARNARLYTPTLKTPTSGDVLVRVTLGGGAAPSVVNEVTLPLQPDLGRSVSIVARTDDPTLQCLGCQGSRAVALPPAMRAPGRDSLWLVWGGNSIRNPGVP